MRADVPAAFFNRGNVLAQMERHEEALDAFEKALQLDARNADVLNNCGNVLAKLNRHEEALARFAQALSLRPDHLDALTNRGNALKKLERYDEAIHHYELAIARAPGSVTAQVNLANTFQRLNWYDEAMRHYELALTNEPENLEAKWNRSLLLLRMGRFVEGWDAYESRWAGEKGAELRPYGQRRWHGEYVDGTLLAWAEQGLGDHILYSGMVSELRRYANSLVLEVEPRLVTLFSRSFPGVQVTALGHELYDGAIDAQTPLASAGKYLRASWKAFPRRKHGYLVDRARALRCLARAPDTPSEGGGRNLMAQPASAVWKVEERAARRFSGHSANA